jgi:hypothetical protein
MGSDLLERWEAMMGLLHEPCTKRIAAGKASGEHLVKLFETLAAEAEATDEAAIDLVVNYLEADDEFVVGQYVPELHLVVRRIDPDEAEGGE